MNIKLNIKTINVPNMLFVVYFVVNVLRLLTFVSVTVGNYLYLVIGTISLVYCVLVKGSNRQARFVVFCVLYMLLGTISFLYNNNMDAQELIWPLGFMSIGLLMYNFTISYKLARFAFYVLCIVIIYHIVVYGGVDNLTLSGSRNTISFFVVLYYEFLLLILYQSKQKLTLLDSTLGFVTCVLGTGRSGVLSGLIMLMFYWVPKIRLKRINVKHIIILVIGVLLVLVGGYVLYLKYKDLFYAAYYNFLVRGFDSSGRIQLWGEYIRKTVSSPLNLLLGSKISGTVILDAYSTNLHNSFLMLHAKYGIIVFSVIVFKMAKALIGFCKKKEGLLVSAFVLMVFRMSFDYTNFNGAFDTVLVCFMLLSETRSVSYSKENSDVNVLCDENNRSITS